LKRLLILLLISMPLTLSTGCSLATTKLVYCGFAKAPAELNGAIKIATNELVPVTIEGDTVSYTGMDLGGMYAVRGADLKLLIQKANANNH
jgi:hypothetical protein